MKRWSISVWSFLLHIRHRERIETPQWLCLIATQAHWVMDHSTRPAHSPYMGTCLEYWWRSKRFLSWFHRLPMGEESQITHTHRITSTPVWMELWEISLLTSHYPDHRCCWDNLSLSHIQEVKKQAGKTGLNVNESNRYTALFNWSILETKERLRFSATQNTSRLWELSRNILRKIKLHEWSQKSKIMRIKLLFFEKSQNNGNKVKNLR